MSKGFLGSVAVLLVGAALAAAQQPAAEPASTAPATSAGAEATFDVPITFKPASVGPTSTGHGDCCVWPIQLATPCPPIVNSPHPWNPPVHDGTHWPYVDEPWRATDNKGVPDGQFWVRGEYLLWALKEGHLPPLVSSGSQVLIGDTDANLGSFSGGRFTGGVWASEDHDIGVEGGYFFLPEQTAHYDAGGGPGLAPLAAPFINATTGQGSTLLLNGPGRVGGAAIDVNSGFQGGDADLVFCVASDCYYRIELLTGFRYLDLGDNLEIRDAIALARRLPHGGDRLQITDEFDTRNHFYAGKVEGRGEYHWGGLVVEALAGLSLGGNAEFARVNGATLIVAPPRPRAADPHHGGTPGASMPAAGLFAQPSNIGDFYAGQFGVVPEFGITLGYQVCRHLRIFAGYTFLYWSDIARAGDQIDTTIDPRHVPALFAGGHGAPATRPEFSFHETDFWAQGGTFGVQIDY